MKRYVYLALALVLTASVLAGCGCTNQKMDNPSQPTILPTNEEVWDTSEPTTRATTQSTMPSMTMSPTETMDRGNGPLEDTTAATTDSTENTESTGNDARRSSGVMPKMQ